MEYHEKESPACAGTNILLVEDDANTRELIVDFLKELGISTVHQMSNGIEAQKFMDSNPHWQGVILCDWNMPRMSGASLYRQLKNTHSHIPFIMITGRNDEDSVLFAKDNGIFAYILKPISIEQLQEKIERVLITASPALYTEQMAAPYSI